ncbi:hypothetical protein C2U70_25110 [Bradyrhizobium guangdongense]|uniref:hypothetical protein n=1 Tax=Bradyrhizobium guangdongense TaxID=1325090 RepID=UPI0011263726|nr:hypothetical protein [Bradyrhizobium guangdongense]TPQ31040.1 hypothetical protein C2U70_25110 [Bradyrhizobium guangdongense]
MDLATIATAIVSSLGSSAVACYWLAQEVIKSRLQKDLEERKSQLSQQLETHKLSLSQDLERTKSEFQLGLARDKALFEGAIRKEIETQLGEGAAQRQYELEARRRLYLAIGPLRFQLMLACRDLTGRIQSFAFTQRYHMNLASYYGRSTLYRILRPIAICELIEEQIALADFSIDPSAIDCLRFRRTITRTFSGDELPCDHPQINWDVQEQHVFADAISSCARRLIATSDGKRVLRFDEFEEQLDNEGATIVAPFDSLLIDFTTAAKPIFWIRLVSYANACNRLVSRLGGPEFASSEFPVEEALKQGKDPYTLSHLPTFLGRIQSMELIKL